MEQISQHGIMIYTLPDCDEDEDDDYKEQCNELKVGHIQKSLVIAILLG